MSSLDDDVLDDLLYGGAGDAEDHGGSSDGDAEPDCTAPRLHATERQGLDIAGLPSSASHQSSTLRASLDEELDPGSSRGRPMASPPVEISGIGRHRSAGAGTATATAAAVAAGNVRPRGTYTRLGTSAPIAIPNMMNRWRSDGGRSGAGAVGVGADVGGAAAAVAATFVPPHQLSRQEDFAFSFSGASPSATIKRDRLRARNAILRSTGFLEPGAVAAAAAATGEGLPLSAALPAAAAAAAAAAAGEPGCGAARTPATSTLTAALTTIGEL